MPEFPFWKNVYRTVTGSTHFVLSADVEKVLKECKEELLQSLLIFKPYAEPDVDWKPTEYMSLGMQAFIKELGREINLQTSTAYLLTCNYLMYDYFGKIKEFWKVTEVGNTAILKENIFNFYVAERMFMLKVWRHMLESVYADNKFHDQFQDFMDTSISQEEFQDNLILQFQQLVLEEIPEGFFGGFQLRDKWFCRNKREQIEVLSILALTAQRTTITNKRVYTLFNIFIQNNFGTQPPLPDTAKYISIQDQQALSYAHIVCFFVVWEKQWQKNDTSFWQSSDVSLLDRSIIHLSNQQNQCLFATTWLGLKFKMWNNVKDGADLMKTFEKVPFETLERLLQHPMCQNSALGEIMHAATYKIIDELCLVSSDQKELFIQQGFVPVFAEILKKSSLCRFCLKKRHALDEILNIAIAVFPFFFNNFSYIAASLLESEECYFNKAIELLTRFPSYLSQMKWSKAQENLCVLQQPLEIHPGSSLIVFPPETTVGSYSICDLTLVQYKTPYNYFHYVEYLVDCLMKIILDNQPLNEDLVLRIEHAYKVIIALIKHDSRNLDGFGILNLFHRLNNLQVCLKGHYMKYTLMKLYFIMQKTLIVDRHFRHTECTPNFIWTTFFPVIALENDDMRFTFKDTMLTTLFRDESLRRDHSVVCSFIEILANLVIRHSNYNTSVQLSGVIYILDSIFSHHLRWSFEDDNQRALITLNCLSIFESVLAKDRHNSKEHLQKMYDFCKQALLYDGDIIDTYLGLFVKEKNYLIFLMERETNWVRGPSLIKFDCIRQQLSLLLVLMKISENIERCVFRSKVNFVVKPITSYFTNFYNPVLAELSCRFLEMKAKDYNVSLLPLLELDHYQVQALFLEKLRDSLEGDQIKIAIINLINTCVANQDGMTAAFFNLKCFHYWDGSETDIFSGDSICDFMIDYLQNLKKSDEYLKNPLQLGILYLFKTLWVNHRERLVENIARLSDFWPVMLGPFLNDFVQDVNVYETILKIINMEINITRGGDMLHPKFVNTLKLFVHDNKRLKDWVNFVTNSSWESEKNILLLSTWTEFLVVSNKVWPEIFTDEMKLTLIDSFLNGLNLPYSGSHYPQILYTWLEVYLVLLSSWNQDYNINIVQKLTTFLSSLRTYYKRIEVRIREVILSLVYKTIEGGGDFFVNHPLKLLEFLYPLNWMLEDEFSYLSEEVWQIHESKIVQHLRPWLLVILIGKALLNLKNYKELGLYFHFQEYITKILSTFIHLIQNTKTFSFAKLTLEYLIQHALSPLAGDFLNVDLIAFYGEIRPPVLKISLGDALSDGLSANLKDWWLIFILLIKLHTILLNTIGVKFLPSAFSFIKQHDKVFFEMVSLTKHTVDVTALTLVHETLQFFYAVLKKKPVWYAEEPESYQLLLAATKTTLNACVLSVVGYKKLNFYEIPFENKIQHIDEPDVDLTVTVLNKLCEIIYWSCITLTQTLPNIVDELCTVNPDEPINLLVRNDFSVPRFELPIPCDLTYGMLLCLADFLCKALNQLSPDTPQTTPRTQKVDMATLKENRLEIVYQHCTVIYHKFIGFMVYVQRSDELPSDSISSLLHYDLSISSSSTVLSLLDYQFVRYALEALMGLLLTETFFAVRVSEEEVLATFRRELTSEIQFFYEFVRKHTTELLNRSAFDQIAASISQPLHADVINKYFALQVSRNASAVSDENFIIVVALWFMKVLGLNN